MSLEIVPLSPLDRGQLGVMRVRGAIAALGLLVPAVVLELGLAERLPVRGVAVALALVAGLWLAVIAPPRRFRHWGYAFTARELHVARGWWTRVHTIVPVSRVQHIDVTQGPIERGFGVARLVLHTAGTAATLVSLPGISRERAEAIRDEIRLRLGGGPQ
jgi:membrane protein YdbS with pleckstrin-like domain